MNYPGSGPEPGHAAAHLPYTYLGRRERWMPDVMGNLNNYLSDKQWLEGDDFTVADVAMGSYLLYIPAFCPQVGLAGDGAC